MSDARQKSEASLYGQVIGASLDREMSFSRFTSVLGEFVEVLGFDHFSFASSRLCKGTVYNQVIADTYSKDWKSNYLAKNYAKKDPLFQNSARSLVPFFWGHDEFVQRQHDKVTDMFSEACDYGIRFGITFPVHTKQDETCLLTVSGKRSIQTDREVTKSRFQQLSTASNYVSAFLLSHEQTTQTDMNIELSPRQKECLLWTLEGKTSWEIAKIIDRSKATVEFHIQKAIKVLGASNKVHAAIIASKMGLV